MLNVIRAGLAAALLACALIPALAADKAFERKDLDDAANWLRLSRTVLQIRPRDEREKALLLDRASTAAYIAYRRAGDPALEADSLAVLGRTFADRKQWRPALDSLRLSLDMRETAELRGQYERLRVEYGFRYLNYAVDTDA